MFLGSNYSGQIFAYTSSYNTNYVIEWDAGDLSLLAETNDVFKVMDEGSTNIVNGGEGHDTIYGSAGNDTLNGGEGIDEIHSGTAGTVDDAIANILAINNNVFYNEATNSFYQYVSGTISYTDAAAAAQTATLNGYAGVTGGLATITSVAEQTFIGDNLVNNGDWAWIDGSDAVTEGSFILTDGSALNGSLNWQGGSPNSTNTADRDNLLIWDGGGDVLYAWADASNARGYVIEWSASDLVSSVGQNILNGGNGADDLYGASGSDVFVFDNTNDIDDVFNFDLSTGDAIDISQVLSFDSGTDVITDFVEFTTVGSDTVVGVDVDGDGSGFTSIAVLHDVTGLDINTLLADGSLIA